MKLNNLHLRMMMDQPEKSSREKPWAILGLSRRQYDTVKPWKRAKMSKDEFGKLICLVPPEAIKSLKEHADAERLLKAAFGKGCTNE